MNPNEQVELISSMIAKTRKNYSYSGNMFLIWGLATSLVAIAHHVLLIVLDIPNSFWVWGLMIVPSILYNSQIIKQKEAPVKTFTDQVLGIVWLTIGASLLSALVMAGALGWGSIYPVFMLMLCSGTVITARIFKLNSMMWGGLVGWVVAIGSAYVNPSYLLLCLALVSTVAFTIPGIILARDKNGRV